VAQPNRLENLQTLRSSTYDAAFSTAFITLTTGAFLVGFVQSLGGSDLWIGLLASIPSLCGVLQIPGAIWGRAYPSYKRFVTPGGAAWRFLHLPLLILPVLAAPDSLKLVVLTICVGLASAIIAVVNPIYNDWLAEMIPANSRGYYFSRRNAVRAAVGAIVGVSGGVALDSFRAQDKEKLGFSVIFGLALVCACVSFFFYLRMADLRRANPVRQDLRKTLASFAKPFGDRGYRRVLIFMAVFVTGQVFCGPLFAAFARESLKLDFKIIQSAIMMHALGNVLCAGIWGFLSDRFGNKPILILVGASLALNLIPWALCVPGQTTFNTVILLSSHLVMGATWSAVALCQFNLLLSTADPDDRANYIGAGMAVTTVIGGLAPLAGATLMASLRGSFAPEFAYKIVFGVTACIRIIAILFLIPVKEEGAGAFRETLRNLRTFTPQGLRTIRSLRTSDDARSRVAAIQNVGAQGFSAATEEVIKALHDPQPRVRRQAASTLASLGDERAIEALIHMLKDHPALVEEGIIESLGTLAHGEALEALVPYLRSPSSVIRRAAARALGRLGDERAIPYLALAAVEPGDIDLRRAALQGLRMLGAKDAGAAIAAALTDPHPSVRIAASEAVSELDLKEAAPALRRSLADHFDEASSEAAYALGVVGDRDDLPVILRVAAKCESMITRRRCLLAVARLLGVEAETYRLMLKEGIALDTELMDAMRIPLRTNRRLRPALNRFSEGDETGALQVLVKAYPSDWMKVLAAQPVEELFLVAVLACAKA